MGPMRDVALLGVGRWMIPVPGVLWRRQIASAGAGLKREQHRFMSDAHRRVHHFVVRELPLHGQPLTPEEVAAGCALSRDRVVDVLDDLERRMTFLVRDDRGAVTWAYPVTVDETPHHVTFETGERLDAA
jgi:hypothetical protein